MQLTTVTKNNLLFPSAPKVPQIPVQLKYSKEVELLKDYENSIKSSEPYQDFKHRIIKTFDTLTDSNFSAIAIVTHGGPISCIFRVLGYGEFSIMGHCAFFEIVKEKGNLKLLHIENAELEK